MNVLINREQQRHLIQDFVHVIKPLGVSSRSLHAASDMLATQTEQEGALLH